MALTNASNTEEIKAEINALNEQLSKLTYYDNLNDYAKQNGRRQSNCNAEHGADEKTQICNTRKPSLKGETLSAVCSACGVESQQCLDNGIQNIIDWIEKRKPFIFRA